MQYRENETASPAYGSSYSNNSQVLSISDLTRCIRGVIEAEDLFRDVWVRGEISNLVNHSSGHRYFSLKDNSALIRCVIWSNSIRGMRFDLAEGMSIVCRGRVTVYEKQGQYQLVVSEVTPDGQGALYVALEQLKARLQAEGLFSAERKKPLPVFPRRIAIVTSRTAAALRDMISIANRRMPGIHLALVPALMQGADSEASVVESLGMADSVEDVDVIILGRGGGSIEDLWTFNSESVVRAIASCSRPVVSAIGHETDYTLSDFAADLRAPTPSAAMELVVPDRRELAARVSGLTDLLTGAMDERLHLLRTSLESLAGSPCFRYPERMVQDRSQTLDLLSQRMQNSFGRQLSGAGLALAELSAKLDSLSPLAVLGRGYGIVRRVSDGGLVRSVGDVSAGETIETTMADGTLISEVKEIRKGLV